MAPSAAWVMPLTFPAASPAPLGYRVQPEFARTAAPPSVPNHNCPDASRNSASTLLPGRLSGTVTSAHAPPSQRSAPFAVPIHTSADGRTAIALTKGDAPGADVS